jgi:predicted permease
VQIFDGNATSATVRWPLSVAEWQAIAREQKTMSSVGAMATGEVPVVVGTMPSARTRVNRVSSGIFTTLGIRAAVGRVILPSDEPVEASPVVVISDGLARRAYGSASDAVGKMLQVDGRPCTIVGVLAPGVKDLGGYPGEIWPSYQPRTPTRRGPFFLVVLAKRKPDVSPAANAAELRAISKRIFPLWQQGFTDSTAYFKPLTLQAAIIGEAPKTLWMFAGAAALLLLIAVTNVANLMLARMSTRHHEVSLRQVLGASRGRLVRLVATESMVVAGTGAVLGAVCAWGLLKMLVVIAGSMPRLDLAAIDMRAMAFAVAVGLLTGLAIGVHPVLTLVRNGPSTGLQGSRGVGVMRLSSRMRGALVAVEFALALPLLAGASQLMSSVARLQRVDVGFDPAPLAYARVVLPQFRYDSQPKVIDYWRRAISGVAQVPGVTAVGYSSELPPTDLGLSNDFFLDGDPQTSASKPVVPWVLASASYFDAMGARLIAGRNFTPADTGPDGAVIVSESFVKKYSPNRSIIGRKIWGGGCSPGNCETVYIVGVVSDVKYDGVANTAETVYEPSTRLAFRSGFLLIRTRGEPRAVIGGVRNALHEVDPMAAIDAIEPMEDRVYSSTAQPRHWAMLLTGFATAALSLAAVGIFGLLSYLVTTMRREIGVRVALGAQRGEIAGMIVKRGLLHCAIGTALGVALALAGRRLIQASLYDAEAGDPATLIFAAGGLLLVAVVAAWIPARRAARIDARTAIRSE